MTFDLLNLNLITFSYSLYLESSGHFLNQSIFLHASYHWRVWCNVSFDLVSCWPTTEAGFFASIPCFEELMGVDYDSSRESCLHFQKYLPSKHVQIETLFDETANIDLTLCFS